MVPAAESEKVHLQAAAPARCHDNTKMEETLFCHLRLVYSNKYIQQHKHAAETHPSVHQQLSANQTPSTQGSHPPQ